jgi:cell division septation protein DedD
MGDVFEDEAPPRRRASAQDYHQAYRDYEEGYEHDERRRSRAPWLVLLLLIIAAALAAAAWYYWYYIKPGQVTSTEVPVVAAPEKPAKTEPEPVQPTGSTLGTSSNQGALENAPDRRKQIYDRVLGEETIEGNQIVPTQEQPQRVEPAGDQPQPPLQGTLPLPDNQNSGAGTSDATDPLPLPLPPPPGGSSDQQGNFNATTSSEPSAVAGAPDDSSQPVAQPASANDMIAPIPGEAERPEKTTTTTQAVAPPPASQQPTEQPVANADAKPVDPPPVQAIEPAPEQPKAHAAEPEPKKKVASAGVEEIAGPQPMVLTPDGGGSQAATGPTAVPDPVSPSEAQPERKSGSFFNFGSSSGSGAKKRLTGKRAEQPDFSNSNLINAGPKPVTGQTAEPQDQVASVSPEDQTQPLPMPAPEAAQTTQPTGGYIAQLASFRSEAEALAEYDRLRTKHGDVIGGLSPRVTKANISGGTRYRLGVGPVASRDAASRICNSLIAAGERDCLVRGN